MSLPRNLATTVDNIARRAVGKEWNLYAALLNYWPEIVGADYARSTTPVKISFPQGKPAEEKWAKAGREDGVLHIRLPQGLVMEFGFLTEQIRQRIAVYFGYNAIARIMFEPYYGSAQQPAPQPAVLLDAATQAQLQGDLRVVESDELRLALEKLGQTVLVTKNKPRS